MLHMISMATSANPPLVTRGDHYDTFLKGRVEGRSRFDTKVGSRWRDRRQLIGSMRWIPPHVKGRLHKG